MDNLQTAIEKTRLKFQDSAFFYISTDAERAYGLEEIIPAFHAIFADKSAYASSFPGKLSLVESGGASEDFNSSYKLIKSEEFKKYFQHHHKAFNYIQTFKISPSFEKQVEEIGAELVNTPAFLNRQFENKLPQFEFLQKIGVNIPESEILNVSGLDFKQLSEKYQNPFVIQFNRGHTGESTFFIKSEEDLQKIKRVFPEREVKVSEFIGGIAYTVNAAVYNNQTFVGGLSYQITGIKSLTPNPGGTVGNDFSLRTGFEQQTQQKIIATTTKIGDKMAKSDYKGLFGLDFIVKEGIPYVIEINARQPASIPFFTKIQLKNKQIPLSLLHIAAYLDLDLALDQEQYNVENTNPQQYSQVFLRAPHDLTINSDFKVGNYRLQSDNAAKVAIEEKSRNAVLYLGEEDDKPLIYQDEELNIARINENAMIILTFPKGKSVKAGQELARIQLSSSAYQSNGQLRPWIIEVFNSLQDYLK